MLKRFFHDLLKRFSAESGKPPGDREDSALDQARERLAAGDEKGASGLIEGVLSSFPRSAAVWNSAGILKLGMRDYAGARRCFERALELSPRLGQAHSNIAIALIQQGLQDEGKHHLHRAIALEPRLLAPRENLAALLTGELDPAAVEAWNDVLELEPNHPTAHAGMACMRLREGRLDEARALYARAHALGVGIADTGLDEATLDALEGDVEGARAKLEALRGAADDADIDWNLALMYLSAGDFAEGWRRYDARLRRSFDSPRRGYAFPEWNGSRLDHGALLIMGEQGLGDEIMFASCYRDVLQRAPHCIIECEPRLEGLFQRSFPQAQVIGQARSGVHPLIVNDDRIVCQIHAGSLPSLFRREVRSFPQHSGYLIPDAARVEYWRRRLRDHGAMQYVGVAWSGGLPHTRRRLRSIPVRALAPMLRVPRAQFVSLQHDDDGREAQELQHEAGIAVHAYPEVLQDVDETAALIGALDAVVSVCSTVVHLAGALGRPVYVLTPRIAEWRYLTKGTVLPWYPSARLLRQSKGRDWSEVLNEAHQELWKLQERKPLPEKT